MKYKLTKAEYDKLSDEMKGEYTADGDSFKLDVEGGPVVDSKAGEKFAAERDKRRAAEKRAKDAEDRLVEMEDKAGDIPALEAKHKKDLDAANAARDAANKKYSDFAAKSMRDGVVSDAAKKLAGKNAAIISPHLAARVTVDMTGDEPKTVFLNKEGKPDEKLTADDIMKEFRDNKDFAAIIVGTQASGGGASRLTSGNGNPGQSQQQHVRTPGTEQASLAALSPRDLAANIQQRGVAIGRQPRQAG